MYPIRNLVPFGSYPSNFLFGGMGSLEGDQHLGVPSMGHLHHYYPLHLLRHHHVGMSEITNTKDLVQIKLDVEQFSADELTVKAVENFLVIEANHGEKEDDHGMISRSFKRRYRIPDDINPDEFDERVTCELSSDGILTISILRRVINTDAEGKVLPITRTGQPATKNSK